MSSAFAHDKKSSQNQENGHHGTESQGFAYKLMENTLASRDYVENILTLFSNEPRLGQVAPPPPFHALTLRTPCRMTGVRTSRSRRNCWKTGSISMCR